MKLYIKQKVFSWGDTYEIDISDGIDADYEDFSTFGAVVVIDDAAYEYYGFSKDASESYGQLVGQAGDLLAGQARVFSIIVPNSMGIMLSSDTYKQFENCSDEHAGISYTYSCMGENVIPVDVYNTLRSHNSEYIYFRTDHHWTALGAYYAYQSICEAIGIPAKDLKKDFTEYVFDGFLGSFYSESGKNPALGDHRDTVYAYDPIGETTLTYYTKNGQAQEWKVIGDVTGWDSTTLYSTFIGGDYPYTHITNASTDSSRSCLVIKESFGNALVPFLAANYSEIHVVDYRHWSGSIQSFAAENQVDDILFVNNVSAVRSSSLMRALDAIAY